ncbi:hypothetical protein FBUS_04291 [Fasciolopsis buskii]|uniref:Trematode PH-like domain-containing protein n=1 Tax=Fasciolopsis buskii TaxID=27845 RepID=A0A8E0RM75_9TREM|nr:hypothetical protein FBUS_04291 [Fasciolopsis buski]
MSGHVREVPYFEDKIEVTGIKICNKVDEEVRENAASLMLQAEQNHDLKVHVLMCLYDTLVFSPPIHYEGQFHRSKIPYREIVGFYLASNYKNRLILVTQESHSSKVYLYGIQMSSTAKTQEISSLLGDARSNNKSSHSKRERVTTVTVLPKGSEVMPQRKPNYNEPPPVKSAHSPESADYVSNKTTKVDQRPSQNGLTNGYPPTSPKLTKKYSGIISNNIEMDWDDIRGLSSIHNSDDIDEQISIGYYNDEAELMDLPRIHEVRNEDSFQDSNPQNAWIENITYISNQPEKGSERSSSGSIYMYVAQQVNSRVESQITL